MKKFLLRGVSSLLLVSILLSALCGFALASSVVGADGKSNIRKSPSLYAKILGTFPKGAKATYLDEDMDDRDVTWYKISYKGITGWVSSMYTSHSGEDSYNSVNGNVWATGGKTNIRKGPSLDSKILGTFAKGERANYLGESSVDDRGETWYKITYGTLTGWVSARYTSRKRPSSSGGSSSSDSSTARVVVGTDGKSYIRAESNRSGKIKGTLPKGATASYLGKTEEDERGVDWYYISYDGIKGWVSSMYTTLKKR